MVPWWEVTESGMFTEGGNESSCCWNECWCRAQTEGRLEVEVLEGEDQEFFLIKKTFECTLAIPRAMVRAIR